MKPPIVTLFLLVIFIVNYSQIELALQSRLLPHTANIFWNRSMPFPTWPYFLSFFFFLPLFNLQKPTQQVEPMGYKNNLVSDYSMSSPGSPCWLGLSGWAVLTQKSKRMVLSDGELRSSRVNSESLLERWLDSPTTWNIWGACSEKISLNAQWAHR